MGLVLVFIDTSLMSTCHLQQQVQDPGPTPAVPVRSLHLQPLLQRVPLPLRKGQAALLLRALLQHSQVNDDSPFS